MPIGAYRVPADLAPTELFGRQELLRVVGVVAHAFRALEHLGT